MTSGETIIAFYEMAQRVINSPPPSDAELKRINAFRRFKETHPIHHKRRKGGKVVRI